MGDMRNAYRVLVGKSERKRPLRKSRHKWENNMKMDLREIEFGGVEWLYLAQDRDWWHAVLNMVMNPWVS
jgi:hypothetical protein